MHTIIASLQCTPDILTATQLRARSQVRQCPSPLMTDPVLPTGRASPSELLWLDVQKLGGGGGRGVPMVHNDRGAEWTAAAGWCDSGKKFPAIVILPLPGRRRGSGSNISVGHPVAPAPGLSVWHQPEPILSMPIRRDPRLRKRRI